MGDLLFVERRPETADLVFGATGDPPPILALSGMSSPAAPIFLGELVSGAIPVRMARDFAAFHSPWEIVPVPALGSSAVLREGVPSLSMAYDNAVNRAPFRWADGWWQEGAMAAHWCEAQHQVMLSGQSSSRSDFRPALPLAARVASGWQTMGVDRRSGIGIPWSGGNPLSTAAEECFQSLSGWLRPSIVLSFVSGTPIGLRISGGWRDLSRRPRPVVAVRWGSGRFLGPTWRMISGKAAAVRLAVGVPWTIGRCPSPGVSPRPGEPPQPPRYLGDGDLVFDDAFPASVHLVFGGPHRAAGNFARVIIPILRSYLVTNDVTLVRVSNALPLPALTLSLSIDSDSWVWGWQATMPATCLDDVLPIGPGDPVELEASINGVTFRLVAEKITRDRRFAQARINVSGRGIAAELGAPYASVVNRHSDSDRTAQQLIAEALTVNGVSIGWGVDWHLADWLVPAGAWSHSGSHIDAVNRIAEAAGGYVQASRNSRTLSILPRYPVAPWDWSGLTPDYSLPSSATSREGVEWIEKPSYNGVYVSGEGAGINGHVRRAGTIGDRLAPMIVDPLITHSDAARQRGLMILSDVGPQLLLTVETPVFSGVGIYPVGSFVSFNDSAESRLGIVRSVAINAVFPTVRQTLEIECHG